MSQEILNNNEQLKLIRTKINENFREVFNELSFLSLADTPDAFAASKYIRVNDNGDGLTYDDVSVTNVYFADLVDTPNSLVSNKYLQVDSEGSSIELVDIDLTTGFISLSDTPSTYIPNKYLKVNSAGDALEFTELIISTDFESLTDTPNEYIPERYVRVNSAGDALEYVDLPTPVTALSALTDILIDATTIETGDTLEWDQSQSKWVTKSSTSSTAPSTYTNFISLSDTPAVYDASSYLRVNAAGNAIEQVKTAPPDGGVGDNSQVQMYSNFAGKLPDSIIAKTNTGQIVMGRFYHINSPNESGDIHYTFNEYQGNQYMAFFKNDATGTNARFSSVASNWQFFDGATTLQDVIDSGNATYHGQKGGSTGAGRLSYWKQTYGTPQGSNNVSWKFMHDLPDAIVTKDGDGTGGYWDSPMTISEIGYPDPTNPTSIDVYYRNQADNSYYIAFNLNTADGDYRTSGLVDLTELTGSTPSLADYIQGGRALYYGAPHVDSVKTGTYISDGTNTQQINLGFRPKMVTIKGVHTTDTDATYTGTNYFYDQTVFDTISESGDYIPRIYRATDARIAGHVDTATEQVEIEINDTGFKIVGPFKTYSTVSNNSAANMLGAKYHYFAIGPDVSVSGDGASSVEQLTDVDVTTTPPSAGQVLVYDDTDSKWKPGAQSNEFVDLTDTPSSLDAGSYLRVNTAGDAIEQIKTAPPDGGVGDNSAIQAASNFAGKLPDQIVMNYTNSGHSGAFVFALRGVLEPENEITYHDEFNDTAYRITFNNDTTGTFKSNTASVYATPHEGSTASLQNIIDGGHAIYHGQKSGTSGAGSLSVIKSATDNFYTELPDAIVATHVGGFETIMRLKFAKSLTDQSNGKNFYYEARFSTGDSDYIMAFKDDTDGTFMGHAGNTDNFPADGSMDQTLRWYIENGRAIYNGGYNESNVVSARIAAAGTILSSNYDWIESVTKINTGKYTITFKAGHFTSIPAIAVSPNHKTGVSAVTVDYENLSTTSCDIFTRKNNENYEGELIDADFSIMAQHQDRPIGLATPQYGIKAWGVFDGTQGSGNNYNITGFSGGNVGSIVRLSTGLYKVTMTTAAPHADYSVTCTANAWGYGGGIATVRHTHLSDTSYNSTTTTFTIEIRQYDNSTTNSNRVSFQVVY